MLLLLMAGCENSFTPKEDFVERVAVFSVLDPSNENQVVRLARSYDAELGEPLVPLTDSEITEAEVFVRDGGQTFRFSDTTVDCGDGVTRVVWISKELKPRYNRDYRLSVQIPGRGELTSATRSPDQMFVFLESVRADTGLTYLRIRPGNSLPTNPPAGYYFRLWVAVQKEINGQAVEFRKEVPTGYDPATGEAVFPRPSRVSNQLYPKSLVTATYNQLVQANDVILQEDLVAQGYGMDRQFYNYYKVVRGFDDPVSMRLDNPDISFIEGGLGVFGVNLPDSTRVPYRRYIK